MLLDATDRKRNVGIMKIRLDEEEEDVFNVQGREKVRE